MDITGTGLELVSAEQISHSSGNDYVFVDFLRKIFLKETEQNILCLSKKKKIACTKLLLGFLLLVIFIYIKEIVKTNIFKLKSSTM